MSFFRRESAGPLDPEIDAVLEEMQRVGVASAEYPKLMTYLAKLHEIKARDRQEPVSRDTMAMVAGNLLGILLIVTYEQKHVLTSKGLMQIIRPNRSN